MQSTPKRFPASRLKAVTAFTALAATTLGAYAGTYTNNFDAGTTNGLTIYTITGAPPEVRLSDGNPGGYLKLTDAVASTTSTVIFPDFDNGFPVQAFTFDVDCRIGNGTNPPADGFCIAFARSGDPVITTGQGFVGGGAEEGTTTGLAIGFDTYDNDAGTADNIGFTVRVDGTIIAEIPATTLYGAIDDASSLQTGPPGEAGWAHFKVVLSADGKLDVFWKETKVVDAVDTGWTPSGGRMVFAARTGGANEAHHFDNLSITTTPAPVAAVTSAKVDDTGYRFEISDFGSTSVVTAATVGALTIDGTTVAPTSVSKTGSITTVTYVPSPAVVNRSSHTYTLEFKDQANLSLSGAATISAPVMPTGPLIAAAPVNNLWNVREVRDGALDPFDIGTAAVKLKEAKNFTDGAYPFMNFSDPDSSGDRGMFKLDTTFITNNTLVDANGAPITDDNDIVQGANISVEITGTTPAELQRTFWVQSDDAFALRAKGAKFINKNGLGNIDPADDSTLLYAIGTGNSNTRGLVQFPAAGTYTLEFLYAEGGGGAFNEVAWAKGDFVNNPDKTNWTLVGGDGVDHVFLDPLPATPTGAPKGQWNIRQISNSGMAGSLANAMIYTSANDLSAATVADGIQPVLNFNDDNPAGKGATGIFNNDLPLIGNIVNEDDNQYIMVARATIPVPAEGDYTLEGTADDGFALKIITPGGRFVASGGPGGIDPLDSSTFYNPTYSDTPTVAAAHFDQAGDYEVIYLMQEGGGGSSGEIAFAPGRYTTIGGTNGWQLLGDSSTVPAPTPFLPATLPGPEGQDGLWGIRFIHSTAEGGPTTQGTNIYNALASVLATPANGGVNSDGTATYLNYSNLANNELNAGLFRTDSGTAAYQIADAEFLGTTTTEDQLVAIAKARLVIPEGAGGDYTFAVHSDDGVALRIEGATFRSVTGDSWIDTADNSSLYFRFGTGDSNIRAVTSLTEGQHDIELIWFEGGGGANFELYAVKNAFANDGDSGDWRLVGDAANGGLALVASSVTPPSSDFQISTVATSGSSVTITFPSTAGVTYNLEWASASTSTAWSSAGTVTGAAGSTTTTATVNAATLNGGTQPGRFFLRVRRP